MARNGGWFTVAHKSLKTCKRCGARSLFWVQSKRTGRYYLAETRVYISEERYVDARWVMPNRPHRCVTG